MKICLNAQRYQINHSKNNKTINRNPNPNLYNIFHIKFYLNNQIQNLIISKSQHRATVTCRKMTMISQSSFISESSQQTNLNSHSLDKIQTDVFNRVIDLKNQKIKMLAELSQCIDIKFQVQSQLVRELEMKKIKEQNLVTKDQYQPIIHKNVQLRSIQTQLQRQILQRTSKTQVYQDSHKSQFGDKSRAKSVLNLSRSKELIKSSHSRSKNIIQNFRAQQNQNAEAASYLNYQENLINQIIEQRKTNQQLQQMLRLQSNERLQKSTQYNVESISKKINTLKKIIQEKQQQLSNQKMMRSIQASRGSKGSKGSRHIGKQTVRNSEEINVVPATYKPPSRTRQLINELLKYINQQQEQKKLLYEDLTQYQKQMQDMKASNKQMRVQLGRISQHHRHDNSDSY